MDAAISPKVYRKKDLPTVLGCGRTKASEIRSRPDFPDLKQFPGYEGYIANEVEQWITSRPVAA